MSRQKYGTGELTTGTKGPFSLDFFGNCCESNIMVEFSLIRFVYMLT